ncbi:dynein regulatory complex protein 8 [Ammospiza nelsoni]|uniref:dynein regulatory complex protein 8 n=1 Tax=Ammospiza nelsoni TaxID=2857394 RepID=UPI00286B01DD|nr:dynein regulatory complex protein 8 [Ammospiza nelsoni]
MAEREEKGEDALVAEIQKKITETFEVFDRESNKTVDVREIGCIVRALGCFPLRQKYRNCLNRFQPIPEDVILHAFEALDENKCGYITKDDLVKHLTQGGEPFTQEEMEDMLAVALDPETDILHYRDYRVKLVVDETKTFPFNG